MRGRRSRGAGDEALLLQWIGRSAQGAVAVVRNGRVALCNDLFRELDDRDGEWRWISGAHAALRYPSLRHLACGEARPLLRGGDAVRACRFERGDRALELRLEQVPAPGGAAVVTLGHDVSDLVHREADRLRGREARLHEERMHAVGIVASGVVHDLNHWLNLIRLRIATLRADRRFEPARRRLDRLNRAVGQAAATVARLQDLAQRRRDRPCGSVDLTAVLLRAVDQARAELDGSGARLDSDVPPLPLVRGTPAELAHLFADLFANARDATPAGGTIEVRARATPGAVVVTVADEGPGIPEENLSSVFDPFFSNTGKRETGLVLSIAYGLMQRLGGSISAANRPGGGSVFTLTFPPASSGQRQTEQRGRRPGKSSILLVDDEIDNLEVLEELLVLEGHRVETAASGKEAVGRFRRGERYDLLLCDLGMPQMTGWQVVRAVRRIAPGTRIWLLTGWANEISEHDPRLADVQGVLGKPLNLDELRELLGDPEGPAPTPSPSHATA